MANLTKIVTLPETEMCYLHGLDGHSVKAKWDCPTPIGGMFVCQVCYENEVAKNGGNYTKGERIYGSTYLPAYKRRMTMDGGKSQEGTMYSELEAAADAELKTKMMQKKTTVECCVCDRKVELLKAIEFPFGPCLEHHKWVCEACYEQIGIISHETLDCAQIQCGMGHVFLMEKADVFAGKWCPYCPTVKKV